LRKTNDLEKIRKISVNKIFYLKSNIVLKSNWYSNVED